MSVYSFLRIKMVPKMSLLKFDPSRSFVKYNMMCCTRHIFFIVKPLSTIHKLACTII